MPWNSKIDGKLSEGSLFYPSYLFSPAWNRTPFLRLNEHSINVWRYRPDFCLKIQKIAYSEDAHRGPSSDISKGKPYGELTHAVQDCGDLRVGLAHIHNGLYLLLFCYTPFPFSLPHPRAHIYYSVLTLLIGVRLATLRRPVLITQLESSSDRTYGNHSFLPVGWASRRGFPLQVPPWFLTSYCLFPCTLKVFAVLSIILQSPLVYCDAFILQDSAITSSSPRNLLFVASQEVVGLG